MSVLAVIPARGGSKRVPRKNLLPFRGKPLLAWTVKEARKSKHIDTLILSTDDDEIARLGRSLGVQILYRPDALATDEARSEDVMRHAAKCFPGYEWVVLLQPTSPLRLAFDIDTCVSIAKECGLAVSYSESVQRNGAVYVAEAQWLERGENFIDPLPRASQYIMPNSRSLDIDSEVDFTCQS